jgi:predicted dehydrogenase
MPDKLTLALIGCGGMMGAHVEGYRELYNAGLKDFEIIACCDVDGARAAGMADSIAGFQGRKPAIFDSVEALLAGEPGLMACDISVVHRNHHIAALPCFEAGKHVTIEKPLGFTMRTGKMMLDAAAKAGTVFQVAENRTTAAIPRSGPSSGPSTPGASATCA